MHDNENLTNLNTLKITFPYSYAIEQVKLNWYDIMIAINNGFLPIDAVVDYAQDELEKNENASQNVLELSIISRSPIFLHSIHPYIDELASLVPIEEKGKTKEKLLYILLKWVYENLSSYDDPLSVVDFIYDDFGFPKTIVQLGTCLFLHILTDIVYKNLNCPLSILSMYMSKAENLHLLKTLMQAQQIRIIWIETKMYRQL